MNVSTIATFYIHCKGFGWRFAGWDVLDRPYYCCTGCGILAFWWCPKDITSVLENDQGDETKILCVETFVTEKLAALKAVTEKLAALKAVTDELRSICEEQQRIGQAQAAEWDRYWKAAGLGDESISVDEAIERFRSLKSRV